MSTRKVRLADLQRGPLQHATLSYDLIKRIRAYKEILGDADPASIDETIDDFCRDRNPEKEIEIWDRIAHVFKNFTEGHQIQERLRRFLVLRALLMISTGAEVPADVMGLTRDQLTELRYNF
jgi:hypothetical protein